jgi:hypothetical protein
MRNNIFWREKYHVWDIGKCAQNVNCKPERKRPFNITRMWKNNIKMDLKEMVVRIEFNWPR